MDFNRYINTAIREYAQIFLNGNNVAVQVVDGDEMPIRNCIIKLILCNKEIVINTNCNGVGYIYNIYYDTYRINVYIDNKLILSNLININGSGLYIIQVPKIKPYKIGGKICNKLNNCGIDSAIVILFKYMKNLNRYVPIRQTFTNEKGNYEFENIGNGNFFIRATKLNNKIRY